MPYAHEMTVLALPPGVVPEFDKLNGALMLVKVEQCPLDWLRAVVVGSRYRFDHSVWCVVTVNRVQGTIQFEYAHG